MGTWDSERQVEIVRQLRDAVDSLLAAVGSGRVGFDHALFEFVEQTDNELSQAFAGVLDEMRAGVPRLEALTTMAKRINVPEVTAFVGALVRSDLENISLVQTLRGQAEQLRQKL